MDRVFIALNPYGAIIGISLHLKLTIVAQIPLPPHTVSQEVLTAAETSSEYLYDLFHTQGGEF